MANDELIFQRRAVDNPRSTTCPHCARVVPLPKDEPWLVVDGVFVEPHLESFRCPECRKRIYVGPADTETQLNDAELDARDDED